MTYCFSKAGIISEVPWEFLLLVAIKGCDGNRTTALASLSHARSEQTHGTKVSSSCLGCESSTSEKESQPQLLYFTSLVWIMNHESCMNLGMPEKVRTSQCTRTNFQVEMQGAIRGALPFLDASRVSYSGPRGVPKTQARTQSYVMESKKNGRSRPCSALSNP